MQIDIYGRQIVLPKPDSHKGENGRVLVIGGSKLFHAASFWAASMASKIVDMVHFSSPAMENNELMRVRAKEKFWDGIVVPWEEIEHYIQEDDCILIGPGMERGEETRMVVNKWIKKYSDKRWVVDGGALQEIDVELLNKNMIVTPNKKESEILQNKLATQTVEELTKRGVTVLAKGPVDIVCDKHKSVKVMGGSPGMTKGGSGDVLAGIVAGLYAKSPAMASCIVASQANKLAGEALQAQVGHFFGASELIHEVQKTLRKMLCE